MTYFEREYESKTQLAANLDWTLPILRELYGVLGYPIGILLDKGQALTNDDLSNLFSKLTVCLFIFEDELLTAEVCVTHKSYIHSI